jgi:hypothetical protein
VTVSTAELEILPDLAVIVVAPAVFDVALPFDPGTLLTVATDLAEELQITDLVMSFLLLSE